MKAYLTKAMMCVIDGTVNPVELPAGTEVGGDLARTLLEGGEAQLEPFDSGAPPKDPEPQQPVVQGEQPPVGEKQEQQPSLPALPEKWKEMQFPALKALAKERTGADVKTKDEAIEAIEKTLSAPPAQ